MEWVVGSATSPAAICARVSQRTSSSSSSMRRISVLAGVRGEAEHERGRERPGLRGVIVDGVDPTPVSSRTSRSDRVLQALARLDEPGDRRITAGGQAAWRPSNARSPSVTSTMTAGSMRGNCCSRSRVAAVEHVTALQRQWSRRRSGRSNDAARASAPSRAHRRAGRLRRAAARRRSGADRGTRASRIQRGGVVAVSSTAKQTGSRNSPSRINSLGIDVRERAARR